MSRKRFTTNEMLHLSGEWLNADSPAHKAILASTDLAPTLPRIQTAHQELASAARPTALNPRLFEIIKEQTDIDDRHDDLIRGVYGLLTSTAVLLGSDGAALLNLRDQLIPDGLSSVQKSYSDEAGQAAQLKDRITPEIRTQIDKILVGPEGKQQRLGAFIDEWIQLGAKLGNLDNEKARLTSPTSDSASTSANIVTARNKWLRTINLFLAIAEAAELDSNSDRLVFGPLRLLESKADRRGRASSPNDPDQNNAGSEPSNE